MITIKPLGPIYIYQEIGDLRYGTLVFYHGSYYVKLDKRSIGHGLTLKHSPRNCILFNISTGSLREIPYNELVSVKEGELSVTNHPNCENCLK